MTILIPLGLIALSAAGMILVMLAWRADRSPAPTRWTWRAVGRDTLAYVLAANLAFLASQLALVVAKAGLPGVRATLFHNGHVWIGDHPNLSFFQGAGLVGLVAVAALGWLLADRASASSFASITGWWMVFHGLISLMLAVAAGVLDSGSVAGQWLEALGLAGSPAVIIGVLATLAVPLLGLHLGPYLAPVVGEDGATSFTAASRRILFPVLLAVPVVALFRMPLIEPGLGSIALAMTAGPWAVVGAAGASLTTTDPEQQHTPGPTDGDRGSLDGDWWTALLATVASIVVAVYLAPGVMVG